MEAYVTTSKTIHFYNEHLIKSIKFKHKKLVFIHFSILKTLFPSQTGLLKPVLGVY